MRYANSVTDLIGNTPLVKLNSVTTGIRATVLAKVEYFNPGGSSKDRIAANIINAAERDGLLKPGGTIVEPTSGNTGVGLALIAQQRGYNLVFVVPDKVAEDKRAVLRAYGARVVVTPTNAPPGDPRSYYSVSSPRFRARLSPTSTKTPTARAVTMSPQGQRFGMTPTASSHILWRVWAPAAPSPAPVGTCAKCRRGACALWAPTRSDRFMRAPRCTVMTLRVWAKIFGPALLTPPLLTPTRV